MVTSSLWSLEPGKPIPGLQLNVRASSDGGVLNAVEEPDQNRRTGDAVPFNGQPFFYQTPWFIICCILVGGFLIYFLYRLRVRQLMAREKELSQLVKSRTLQLEEQSEKLKEMDRVKSRFFANISHEFRTPLTLIMGPLENMLSRDRERKEEEDIHMALRNAQRLLALINQLLDLSRLGRVGLELQAVPRDIIPFLKGITYSFKSMAELKSLQVIFDSQLQRLTLLYDPVKLEKAMMNLMGNALKFTPVDGRITVSAQRFFSKSTDFPYGFLEITVSDTGIGIDTRQLPYIFDRFYQVEDEFDHHHKPKGSGIGLALVKELIALHHGDITVESKKGHGTRFTLRLPLPEKELIPGEPAAEAPFVELRKTDDFGIVELPPIDVDLYYDEIREMAEANGKDERNVVLVVEDNRDVRKFIRGALEEHYRVVEAADGEAGIQKTLDIIPDLIVSDVMMPRKDGFQLCEALKKDIKTSHIPIILLTAKASEDSMVSGLAIGADDYITKPFNAKILLTRIDNLIRIRRTLQESVQRELILQPTEIAVSSLDKEFMTEMKAVIEKNLADMDFGVDQLAEALYMSRPTLNRKMKAITGESPNQFIQSHRLKRGAQLLKANFGNVTEVAFAVGFSTSNYFTRSFKKKFQQSPQEYQLAQGNEPGAEL